MFNNATVPYSIPVSPVAYTSGGNGGMFGGDEGILGILLIIALLGGFGNGGFGGGFGGGGVQRDYVLATDFATIERKLDSVNSGICDATFALNNTIVNGNNALNNTLTQGFAGLNTGMITQGYESRLATNALGMQLAQCCCDIGRSIDGVNYNIATQSCDTRNVIQTGIRDLIDNQNANYRALHDEIVANRIEDKDAQIAQLTMQLNKADLAASQAAQNAYLINEINPCPKPAIVVQPPQNVTFPTNCCGQFNGYGNYGYGYGVGTTIA